MKVKKLRRRNFRNPQAPSVIRVVLQAHPDGYRATGKTTEERFRGLMPIGDYSFDESDVDAGHSYSRITRPTGNTSDKKAKKGEKKIGLQTDSTLEEISIVPITRKSNVKDVEPSWKN